jgi:hypothetical protein
VCRIDQNKDGKKDLLVIRYIVPERILLTDKGGFKVEALFVGHRIFFRKNLPIFE